MSYPKVCASCGINFMKKNTWDESEKTCNSCINKEKKNKPKVNTMKISIECTPEEYLKIEEICFSNGKTFSEYLIGLHKKNIESEYQEKEKTQKGKSKQQKESGE